MGPVPLCGTEEPSQAPAPVPETCVGTTIMTRPINQAKPPKPYPEFPLVAHGSGQWCLKIAGKRHYFGKWSEPQKALEEYVRQFPYLNAGTQPPAIGMTLGELLNRFDDYKTKQLCSKRIGVDSYNGYMRVAHIVADVLGKSRPVAMITPHDLDEVNHKLSLKKNGEPASPVIHKKYLTAARMIFKYGNESHNLNVRYAQALKSPEKRLIRQHRAAVGMRMFTADQITAMLQKADPVMKVVILLGINVAYGPHDCIALTPDHIQDGFANFPRPKTGVDRRCPLWKQTQDAIAAIADDKHVLTGGPWNRHKLAKQFKKLATECGCYKKGLSIYSLRRTFATVAKNSGVNQSVIDKVMGHESPAMSELYNQKVFDRQLVRLIGFVDKFLIGKVKL